MAKFRWTKALKKAAHDALLQIANAYEVKQKKSLRGIIYLDDGRARYIGKAHDYSVDLSKNKW